MCRSHPIECPYEFENWNSIQDARQYYLDKANTILTMVSFNDAITVIKNL